MKEASLVSSYDFELAAPACHPGDAIWSVKVTFEGDISGVLPLLNAMLEGADYNHAAKVLLWKAGGRKYAFRPDSILVAPVHDREEASALCREAVDTVNDAWKRRSTIEPDYSRLELPTVMEIFKKLPRSNCKDCGHPTCMAFAAAYRSGEAAASDCPSFGL